MKRKAHESEYMSSDIWKRNVPPVTNFKRGSAYNKFGMWGDKFGGNFVPETLKKPIKDLEILFKKLRNNKDFILERDKYFKNWIGSPTRFIKLNNLSNHIGGAQIWSKVVSDANGGAHKIYNATVHSLLAKKAGKKFIVGDTGAG